MSNLLNLVPKNKSDIETVTTLQEKSYPEYRPILKDLFEWIKDMNWPIAPKILPLLIAADSDTIPYIKSILDSNDAIWKYNTLSFVVKKMSRDTILKLKEELHRLSQNPNQEELTEGVNLIASDLLTKL